MPQKQKKMSQLKPASSTQRNRKGATQQDRKLENAALLQTPPTPAKPEWEGWTPRKTETWFPNTPMDMASEKMDFIPTGAQCGDHMGILDFCPHPGVSLFLFPLGWWQRKPPGELELSLITSSNKASPTAGSVESSRGQQKLYPGPAVKRSPPTWVTKEAKWRTWTSTSTGQ